MKRTLPSTLHPPRFFAAALLFLIVVAASAPGWALPLQRDQGVYAACGSVLVDGGAPYVDCWDTKGPLTHYTYALAELVFGVNLWAPYVLNAFVAAATSLALAALTARWLRDRAIGWAVGLVYGLLLISIPFDHNAQSEGFANLFLVLAALIWRHERARNLIAAGALLGLAVGFKYTIVAPAGALGLALWMSRANGKRWLRAGTLAFSGTVAVWLLAAASLGIRGALPLAVEHVRFMATTFPRVQVNPELLLFPGESGPPLFYLQRTLREFARLPALYVLAIGGIGLALRRRARFAVPIAVWLLSALLIVFPQKVFTLYHWTLALPPVALAAGIVVRQAAVTRFAQLSVAVLGLAVAANIGARFYYDQWLLAGPYLTGRITRQELFEAHATWDELEIAEYVAARTEPDDLVWVWGNHSVIYYLSERRSPTRFIFNSPLMARLGPNEFQPRWRDEIVAALYARPPTYLIVTWYDRTWFDYQNPNQQFDAIPEFAQFLDRYYRREVFLERFEINRLIPWWSRATEPALLDAVTVADLLQELPRAAQQPSPNDPIAVVDFALPGERPTAALLLHPDGQVTYDLALPPGGPLCFRADLALDPDSWGWGGDGATFRVAMNNEVILERRVGNEEADRRWHPVLIDVSRFAGQRVQLTLATGPGPNIDFTGDRAGWGAPRVVRAPGATCEETAVVPLN